MNPTRTIFLDAAGTLIEPAEPVAAVYSRHFAALGFAVGESAIRGAFGQVFHSLPSPDYPRHGDGDAAEQIWWRSLVKDTAIRCGLPTEVAESEALFHSLFNHYAAGAAWRVFPEVGKVLDAFDAEGFPMVIVSNFDHRLHRILEDLNLTGRFVAIITSAHACSRKPAAGIFHCALERLGLSPSEAVHIGDSAAADQVGAENAGIRAFLLDRPRLTLFDALEWIRCGP